MSSTERGKKNLCHANVWIWPGLLLPWLGRCDSCVKNAPEKKSENASVKKKKIQPSSSFSSQSVQLLNLHRDHIHLAYLLALP